MICMSSKDSDQLAHPQSDQSLLGALWIAKEPNSSDGQLTDQSVQADLRLHRAHNRIYKCVYIFSCFGSYI